VTLCDNPKISLVYTISDCFKGAISQRLVSISIQSLMVITPEPIHKHFEMVSNQMQVINRILSWLIISYFLEGEFCSLKWVWSINIWIS